MARIFVIEDDEAVRTQLAILLQNVGHEVIEPSSFSHLATEVIRSNPHLVLLDLGLPGTDGQYVARELRQRSDIPIVVLTSRASELDELMSLSLGADDFIAKPYNGQVLLAHIDAILRRTQSAMEVGRSISWKNLTLDVLRSTASHEGKSVELTKNELRILELLMRGEGAVISREELMEALWDSDSFVDDNTLTVNMNRLRQTLGRIGVKDYITTHRGRGYSA